MSFFGSTAVGSLLHQEHHSTLSALNELTRLVAQRSAPRWTDAIRAVLNEVSRAIEEDITEHFSFEEQHLFPRLHQAGATFMVDMLSQEHDDIRGIAAQLRSQIAEFLTTGVIDDKKWSQFVDLSRDLIDTETFHIQKEEMGLLAALSQILSADEDKALAQQHPKHQS